MGTATLMALLPVSLLAQTSYLPDPAPVNQPVATGSLSTFAAPAVPSTVAVGRTKGSFAVSANGAATYSIPLWTPKGIAGLQPSLALVYSSNAGDGLYGMGWNIAGLGAIRRCAKTYGQDGAAAAVFLTSSDLYCLNGNKLRSFAGTTYGTDGAQYQTEIADFSLVISHGAAGTGPTWFEVHAKNGLIYQYGNTTDSALLATGSTSVLTWGLNRISDRFGNHIDVVYTNDTTNQMLRPATITYTTPSATAISAGVQSTPNYQVQFTYVARGSTIPTGFIVGAQFSEPYLAQTITVAAWNGSSYAAKRTNNLTYTSGSATNRSQLHTIQECSTTQCFSPTTVAYQNGSTGWGSAVASTGNLQNFYPAVNQGFLGDLNGDGFQDVVYPDATSGHWYYLLGGSSGSFAGPYDTGVATSTIVYGIDFNADGKTDLLLRNNSGKWRVMFYQSPGGTFTLTDTTAAAPSLAVNIYNLIIGDVDGDGHEDIIYTVSGGSSWSTNDAVYYQLNTGSSFGAAQLIFQTNNVAGSGTYYKIGGFIYSSSSHFPHPDFNGDGRIDYFMVYNNCSDGDTPPTKCANGGGTKDSQWQLWVSTPTGVGYANRGILNSNAPLIGDFNGDGCADIAYAFANGALFNWNVSYGTCDRNGASIILSAVVSTGVYANPNVAVAVDWDGDGLDDIVEPNGNTWGYNRSTGTTFGAWTSLGTTYTNYSGAFAADVSGDGQGDIFYVAASTFKPTVLPHAGAGITADLATSFTDGFGVNYSPSYTQLTKSSVYTKGTGAVYPEQDVQSARTVVSSYSASDGIGGTYSVSELYAQARNNVQRQEFEGFGSIRSLDSRDSLYRYAYFAQLSPRTGLLSEQKVLQSNNSTVISDVLNTVTFATLDATNKRYFPYVSQSVASAYEFAGALNGTLVTQKTTTMSFTGTNGFTYGNPSTITTTTVDKDPTSPWTGSTFTDTLAITPYEVGGTSATGWCIHLPSQMAETRTQTSGSLIHTTSFAVNANTDCELDSRTVEPSSATDKVLTALLYDACGNVKSAAVTGQKPDGTVMTARTTTAAYGTHCIFSETVTNALSQPTVNGYDYSLGTQTSAKDPNLLATSWTYNDLGQKTLEQRPDSTQTAFVLTACTSNCGASTPLAFYIRTDEEDSTSGHSIYHQSYQYYDPFERLIQAESQIAGGQLADTWFAYDALGRLAKKSSPFPHSTTPFYTTYSFDVLNRLSSMSRPISATNATLEHTNYTYQGRTSTVQDPKTYTTTRQSDVLGELGIVTDPDGVSKTKYSYNPFGQLTQITDPATNVTSRTFDALGYLLTGTADPDRGAWVVQLDSFGELVNVRDAKTTAPAWTQVLTYDALGRTTQRVESEGTSVWTWGTVAANHEIGRLKEIIGLGDDETFTFDSVGRPASRAMTWAGRTYTVSYNYNTIGKLNVLTYPLAAGQASAFAVLYGYTNGYFSSAQNYTGNAAGTTLWQLTPAVSNMDPFGHVTDETLGTTTSIRIQSAFDGVTGWLNSRLTENGSNSGNLGNQSFGWDLNGNLSQRQDVLQSLTEIFNYDNLNRIQTSILNGTQNLSVTVDATGNISSRTEGGVTSAYTYDPTHKHAVASVGSSGAYTYDANGNMATRNGLNLQWASYNLPTVINGPGGTYADFSYGPDRQRKQQVANYVADGASGLETTVYAFGLYEHETTSAQTRDKYWVQLPGGTQVLYDIASVSGTQTTYIVADHLGSGNRWFNSAGVNTAIQSYSAYGYRRSANWSGPLASNSSDYAVIAGTTRRGYTEAFHELLDSVNLIHMNGRVYDPVIGRFLSPDPMTGSILSSQSWNPYSYALNQPLRLNDPTGLTTCDTKCKRESAQDAKTDRLEQWLYFRDTMLMFESTLTEWEQQWYFAPPPSVVEIVSPQPTNTGGAGSENVSSSVDGTVSAGNAGNRLAESQAGGSTVAVNPNDATAGIIATGSRSSGGPLLAQVIDPVPVLGIDEYLESPAMQALRQGRLPTPAERAASQPNYGTQTGTPPQEPATNPSMTPPMPQGVPQGGFWLQFWYVVSKWFNNFSGAAPAAPPICTAPTCQA
jgi:RHS repeat-associated protein